jgi:hypothetical protein
MTLKRTHQRQRRLSVAGTLLLLALWATACGSDSATTSEDSSGTSTTTLTVTTPALTGDAALADKALITGREIGDKWETANSRLLYPNDAGLARTVSSCNAFVETVFDGGQKHGAGVSRVLGNERDLVFLYAVVFPTVDAASAMMAAVADPAFDRCWAEFNNVAVMKMPLGVERANYQPATPPSLTATADKMSVKFIEGNVTIGGTQMKDNCVCVFAQVGRGVVEVHSISYVLDDQQRSKVVQAAVDRLRTTLAAG